MENNIAIDSFENRKSIPLLFCLKRIVDFYLGEVNYKTIFNLLPNAEYSFDNDMFINATSELGITANYKEININSIPNHLIPCVVFNDKTPFVLISRKSNSYVLYDPIADMETEINKEDAKKFSSAILVFKDSYSKEAFDETEKDAWFWNPIKSFWKKYIEIGILTLFINLFALAVPLFTLSVYDRVVPNSAFDTLFVFVAGMLIVIAMDIYFKNVRNKIIEHISEKLSFHFEENLLRRILLLQTHHDDLQIGIKANLFKELHLVKDFFATKTVTQVIDLPFFFIGTTVIFCISPVLAIVPIFFAIVVIAFNIIMQKPINTLSKQNSNSSKLKNGFLVDTIRGTEVIKLNSASSTKLFHWRNILALTNAVSQKISHLNYLSLNLSQSIIQIVTIAIIIVGVFQINEHSLSVGGLIASTLLASRAMAPIIQASTVLIKLKEIKESLKHLSDFWAKPLEKNSNEVGITELKGNIEFKNISYSYKDNRMPSLENFNLKINAGERVGIIGRTGSGKSTILKLLTGLVSSDKGNIYIDNFDVSTLHPVELRQNIGVMMQEPYIFAGSLKENIELSMPISKERMMQLINLTGLDSLVKKSGQGDGMYVGEGGSNLSIGQKHLIGLARAFSNDPNIFILDEPTTGLDIGLEDTLVRNINAVTKDKTLIVITHRFKALDLVDRVIVIQDGKIVADGKKEDVLNAIANKRI